MGQQSTARVTALIAAIHEELRALAARRGFSQRQLQDEAGVSQSVISKTMYRNASTLSLSQAEALANALGEPLSVIIERAERKIAVREQVAAPLTDAQLAAQILARAEAATKAGYRLAAHPADKVITDDSSWGA
ncbi:helix-turn-helix domain-containing protein [Rothia mucilaginosa]|uniref:helix-turn-helix domain-containing protein n=1 Tax=Rothia mucilaginosa TaxID=43675 RepID=UPI001959848A|nr:helix-turn-helix transcriptional regulator [Rothia mucilaginosa]VTY09711.1 Cro/C1-type HTH DNA-binding domain protein [Rothia mucilaginosa]